MLDTRAIIDFAENKHSADIGELLRREDFKITRVFRTVLKSFDNMPVKDLAKLTEVWKDSSPPRTQDKLKEALDQKQQARFNPGGQKYR